MEKPFYLIMPTQQLNNKLLYPLIIVLSFPLFLRLSFLEIYVAKNLLLYLAILSFFIIWLILVNNNKLYLPRFYWPLLGFFVFALLSGVFSIDRSSVFMGIYRSWQGLLFYFVLGILFFLSLQIDWDTKNLELFLKSLVLVATIISLYGLFNFSLRYVYEGRLYREASLLPWPTTFSFYLNHLWPLALLFLVNSQKFTEKALFSLSAGVIFVANLISFSRTGWALSFIFLLLLFQKIKAKYRMFAICFLIIVLSTVAILFFISGKEQNPQVNFKTRFSSMFKSQSFTQRVELWRTAVNLIKERPLVGFGPDTYQLVFKGYESRKLINFGYNKNYRTPHNYPLFTGATLGLPALLFLLIFVLAAIWFGIKKPFSWLHFGVSLSLVNALMFSLTSQWPAFLLAIFAVLVGVNTEKGSVQLNPQLYKVIKAVFGVFCLVSAYFILLHLKGNFYFQQGASETKPHLKLKKFEQAVKVNPNIYFYWLKAIDVSLREPTVNTKKRLKLIALAKKIHPLEDKSLIYEAILYIDKADYKTAIVLLNKALALRPLSYDAHILKAEALIYEGRFAQAIKELNVVKVRESGSQKARLLNALIFTAEQNLPKAAVELSLLRLKKDTALDRAMIGNAYLLTANLYQKSGYSNLADKAYSQAVMINPSMKRKANHEQMFSY